MLRKLTIPFVAVAASVVAACAGNHSGTYGQPQSFQPIPLGNGLAITGAVFPKDTIGAGYPDQVGHILLTKWNADVAGFTQSGRSQMLGFEPRTQITITNISTGSENHTLNVIARRSRPPARFPTNPRLLMTPSGGHRLVVGFRSGVLSPGKKVTVTLVRGTYLIGCAFHYKSDNMRDVLVVADGATPGPTATP